MRREPTEPERRLWMELRNSRFQQLKFRRQVVIGNRIVDFFCPAKGLVVEIDGHTHDAEKDAWRDDVLSREHGFATSRFTNDEVMRNLDGVLKHLKRVCELRANRWPDRREHHPQTPSSEEEGA